MRVFLRQKKTRLYYGGSGQLDPDLAKAMEFSSIYAASERALSEHLSEVEIVLKCDYLDREILLPPFSTAYEVVADPPLPVQKADGMIPGA
jgi:hypothetical protein